MIRRDMMLLVVRLQSMMARKKLLMMKENYAVKQKI
jgi:hypothetical protein